MSKLKIIRDALESRKDTITLFEEHKSFGEDCSGGLVHDAHWVHYAVAPKTPTYSISKLNAWFESLIPNYHSLNPDIQEKFRFLNIDKGHLYLGFLRFDEAGLGYTNTVTTRIIRITDEDFLKNLKGFKEGLKVTTEEIKDVGLGRMIIIQGCPNKEIAEGVLEGKIGTNCTLPKLKIK